jgi:hypothetical protein
MLPVIEKKIYQIIAYRTILEFDPPGFDLTCLPMGKSMV